MQILQDHLNELEFPKLLEEITPYTYSPRVAEKISNIKPLPQKEAEFLLKKTSEFLSSYESENFIPFDEYEDIEEPLKLMLIENFRLEASVFLRIRKITEQIGKLQSFFPKFSENFPNLEEEIKNIEFRKEIIDKILDEFKVEGINKHIINGHVPVHVANGENPIKANGKLMVIDGGFSQAYHKETGIAGYTLVYHSRSFALVQHEPFTSANDAIEKGTDIKSTTQIIETIAHRILVADTDKGKELNKQIADLKALLYAYSHGLLKEKETK